MQVKSIGREKAIEMAQSKWWEGKSAKEICDVQLFTKEMCVESFSIFHGAMETCLSRPIWTHEFANWEGLCKEYLTAMGESV
jgi:hypothetical protein